MDNFLTEEVAIVAKNAALDLAEMDIRINGGCINAPYKLCVKGISLKARVRYRKLADGTVETTVLVYQSEKTVAMGTLYSGK